MPDPDPRAAAAPPAPGAERAALPLHAMPGHLFRRLHQQGVALYCRHAAGFDLTPVQYAALHAVGAWPGADQSTIGRAIACDKATLGPVLDRLQAKGLVRREPDPADRRTWRVRPTADGASLLARIEPAVQRVQRDLLAPLTEAEATLLMTLLTRLAGAESPADAGAVAP